MLAKASPKNPDRLAMDAVSVLDQAVDTIERRALFENMDSSALIQSEIAWQRKSLDRLRACSNSEPQ